MKRLKRSGYVAIEVVVAASFILAVGFFALLNFSTSGTNLMDTVNGKLAGLGIFGGSGSGTPIVDTVSYDENGYPEHLNISMGDVAPFEDFMLVWDNDNSGWGIRMHSNASHHFGGAPAGDGTIIVPSIGPEGHPIVSILDDAIWGINLGRALGGEGMDTTQVDPVTSIVLPNTIKRIGRYGISGANIDLGSFVIPNSVTSMGLGALSHSGLTSVVIPNSLTTLGDSVFSDNELTSVTIPSSITVIDTLAFANNNLSTVVIPGNVLNIGAYAFANNRIESVTLFDGLEVIHAHAFSNNLLTLEEVPSLPDSVTYVGPNIFENQFETWNGVMVGY